MSIGISSSDESEGTVSVSSLVFTDSNWDTGQTVTVTGVDDSDADDDVTYSVVLDAAVSNDSGYDGLDAVDVDVTNVDDESNPSGHYLKTGVLTNVNNQGWETVQLDHSYDSMVVVTTLNYGS